MTDDERQKLCADLRNVSHGIRILPMSTRFMAAEEIERLAAENKSANAEPPGLRITEAKMREYYERIARDMREDTEA